MSTDTGFNRLKNCRYGPMVYNVHDEYVGRSLDLYGEFSEGETEMFRQIVRPGDLVVEVGANVGAHTVWFGKTVGPSGFVFAFEPQRLVFQLLCGNVALNSLVNVSCHAVAVGEAAAQVIVPVLDPDKSQNFGGLPLGGFTKGERVPVVALDTFNFAKCRLLKVDVEGMETAVLKGARQTIARCKPVLYVENDREERSAELIKFIDSIGYDMYWHTPMLYSEKNFFNNPENVFPNIASLNMMCVPRGVPVQGAQRVKVP